MKPTKSLPPQLLALSPGDLSGSQTARFLSRFGAAFEAGLPGLLLREPGLSDRELLRLGERLQEQAPGLWLGVHDRLHLAAALGAQGAHLGFRSLPPEVAQQHFGAQLTIGLSTHAEDTPARWAACDYRFHSPVLATSSKPLGSAGYREPLGFGGLQRAVESSSTPIWALGGLQPEHVPACLAAGARGVAVLSGIWSSPDPGAASALYWNAF